MPCRVIKNPSTAKTKSAPAAIIVCRCSPYRPPQACVVCQLSAPGKLTRCDGPKRTQNGMPKWDQATCSVPICIYHALHIEPDWDLCPGWARHIEEFKAHHGLVITEGV